MDQELNIPFTMQATVKFYKDFEQRIICFNYSFEMTESEAIFFTFKEVSRDREIKNVKEIEFKVLDRDGKLIPGITNELVHTHKFLS